jgi:hypothetical protein
VLEQSRSACLMPERTSGYWAWWTHFKCSLALLCKQNSLLYIIVEFWIYLVVPLEIHLEKNSERKLYHYAIINCGNNFLLDTNPLRYEKFYGIRFKKRYL